MADKDKAFFDAIQQVPNLRSGLVDALAAQIEAGDLSPGQRLPTEQAIMSATGVSRTVVREALAALRARGLITTRQGLGAFVANDPKPRSFSIVPYDLQSIDDVISVIELRIGIEVEAAGFAALRRDDEDLKRIRARLDQLEAAIEAGGSGAVEDAAFHRSILVATHNPYYARLFDTFGTLMLPRQWAYFEAMQKAEKARHMNRMRREHEAVLLAIEAGDDKSAQRALRSHLSKSLARFIALRDTTERAGASPFMPSFEE
jgi:DNA-binding FadR family transcriptional regulator